MLSLPLFFFCFQFTPSIRPFLQTISIGLVSFGENYKRHGSGISKSPYCAGEGTRPVCLCEAVVLRGMRVYDFPCYICAETFGPIHSHFLVKIMLYLDIIYRESWVTLCHFCFTDGGFPCNSRLFTSKAAFFLSNLTSPCSCFSVCMVYAGLCCIVGDVQIV